MHLCSCLFYSFALPASPSFGCWLMWCWESVPVHGKHCISTRLTSKLGMRGCVHYAWPPTHPQRSIHTRSELMQCIQARAVWPYIRYVYRLAGSRLRYDETLYIYTYIWAVIIHTRQTEMQKNHWTCWCRHLSLLLVFSHTSHYTGQLPAPVSVSIIYFHSWFDSRCSPQNTTIWYKQQSQSKNAS